MKKLLILPVVFLLAACGNSGSSSSSGQGSNSTSTTGSAPVQFSVTWKNWDGSVLRVDTLNAGSVPSYGTTNPVRPSDANYTYTFAYWSPAIVAVTQNATYTAIYEPTPIYEINAEQFAEAVNFKDKNFTANVIYNSSTYREVLMHLETNELYGAITNGTTYSYRRLIDDGIDKLSYYDSHVDGNQIVWTFQDGCSGDYDDVYTVNKAFDDDVNIKFIMENITNFNQITYDSEHHYYTFSKSAWNVTLTFHGNQLHKATMENGTHNLYVEFLEYGTTVLPALDEDLIAYRAKQFADKGALSSFAHNTNYYYDESIEFSFTYSEYNKNTTATNSTYYGVTMDSQYRKVSYDDGDHEGTYIQDVGDDTLYKKDSDEKYYPITDPSDPGYGGMDFSNPYNDGFGQDFLTGFYEFTLLVDEGDVDDWENYSVRREQAEFDVYSAHFDTTLHFSLIFYEEIGVDKWVVIDFTFTYETDDYRFTYGGTVATFNVDPMSPEIIT